MELSILNYDQIEEITLSAQQLLYIATWKLDMKIVLTELIDKP